MPQHLKQASRARKPFITRPRSGRPFRCLLVLAALLTLVSGPAPASLAAPATTVAGEKLVLAFYYMWYGPGFFESSQLNDRPVEPYVSDRPDVIARHVREAKAAGIDAFVAAWSGTGTETDSNIPKLLDEAARQGFKVTIYFETPDAMKHGEVSEQLSKALARFSAHPAYLRVGGKPVVFFWSPQSLGSVDKWQQVRQIVDPSQSQLWSVETTNISYLDVFDNIHLYSGGKWDNNTNLMQVNAKFRGMVDSYNTKHGYSGSSKRTWTAGVIPGWDETRITPKRDAAKLFPRRDGALYEESWQAAIASNPEWTSITSFNEWSEQTQIESSKVYGDFYLNLTALYASLWKRGPDTCTGGTHFSQTGHSICKAMERFWQQNGGLAQFGYPVSEPLDEASPTDGKVYRTQYFERARFELHPENAGTPYEVLLTRLGTVFHKPDTAVPPLNDGLHRYFPETGHNVSTVFTAYWQAHGGLAVNGYPISEELQEVLADGKTYTVQYFERARFELHPENPAPYNVLLGALGSMAWSSRTAP
jgi:hypothetical protein